MVHFKNFNTTFMHLQTTERGVMQNLSSYAEVLDDIKINSAFYKDYYIRGSDRPDNVERFPIRKPNSALDILFDE